MEAIPAESSAFIPLREHRRQGDNDTRYRSNKRDRVQSAGSRGVRLVVVAHRSLHGERSKFSDLCLDPSVRFVT